MVFDSNLTIRSKNVYGYWCLKCNLVELVFRKKVDNAVKSAKRFLFHGKLDSNENNE